MHFALELLDEGQIDARAHRLLSCLWLGVGMSGRPRVVRDRPAARLSDAGARARPAGAGRHARVCDGAAKTRFSPRTGKAGKRRGRRAHEKARRGTAGRASDAPIHRRIKRIIAPKNYLSRNFSHARFAATSAGGLSPDPMSDRGLERSSGTAAAPRLAVPGGPCRTRPSDFSR